MFISIFDISGSEFLYSPFPLFVLFLSCTRIRLLRRHSLCYILLIRSYYSAIFNSPIAFSIPQPRPVQTNEWQPLILGFRGTAEKPPETWSSCANAAAILLHLRKKSRALSHGLPYNISTMDYGALCCACFHIYQGLTARGSIHSFWDILDILPMFCLRSRVELLFLIYFIYLILYLFFVGWIVFHFIWVIGPEHGWVDNRMYGYGYPGKAINQKGLKFFFFVLFPWLSIH